MQIIIKIWCDQVEQRGQVLCANLVSFFGAVTCYAVHMEELDS